MAVIRYWTSPPRRIYFCNNYTSLSDALKNFATQPTGMLSTQPKPKANGHERIHVSVTRCEREGNVKQQIHIGAAYILDNGVIVSSI